MYQASRYETKRRFYQLYTNTDRHQRTSISHFHYHEVYIISYSSIMLIFSSGSNNMLTTFILLISCFNASSHLISNVLSRDILFIILGRKISFLHKGQTIYLGILCSIFYTYVYQHFNLSSNEISGYIWYLCRFRFLVQVFGLVFVLINIISFLIYNCGFLKMFLVLNTNKVCSFFVPSA
jgi:hypothetical protein